MSPMRAKKKSMSLIKAREKASASANNRPRLKLKRWAFVILAVLVLLSAVLLILDALYPVIPDSKGYSTILYSNDGEIIHGFLSKDDKWRIRAEIDEISEDLRKAIIFKEDRHFYYHPGINLISIGRALYNNSTSGKRTIGASTITMQLARLISPAERTLTSKIREAFRALQLEFHYSKDEILTMYMNLLPYGGNIEGVKAASMIYFGQLPQELSPAQIAMLTVIPNNPNVLMPANRSSLTKKRNYWIKQLGARNIFTAEETEDALNEDFESVRYGIPRIAPHMAIRLKKSTDRIYTSTDRVYNSTDRIYTSLDLQLQSKVETSMRNYVKTLRSLQITNAAVLVVNNRTMEVEAYAGSAGYEEEKYSGQVDGIRAVRSPGSTLKPALYMLAFDKGYISTKTIVSDVPVNFSGYRPENYDQSYRGKVSIEQALALSLNVPAVDLLDITGLHELNSMLGKADFDWISKNKDKTGLSLILGGCGATLEELTGLYAAFANGGVYNDLKFVKPDESNKQENQSNNTVTKTDNSKRKVNRVMNPSESEGIRISSPGSAYMITEILTGLQRPDLPNDYRETANLPKIAWKTGTSYGRRDAWAIGYNADYTVGVWTGNFDGTGVPELNGTDCAVPLLFMIFNQLKITNTDWFASTPDADFRLVCSETGMVPDTFCHNRVMETFLPGISPSVRCSHLKRVFTNTSETVTYCSECLPSSGYKSVLYPAYSPELVSYYEEMMIPYKRIPDHYEECTALFEEKGPLITSLTDGAEYLVFAGRKQNLMLKSSCMNGTRTVYWYIDKKFLKKSGPNETVYLEAVKGNHTVTCSDDRGRSSSISFKVSLL